jgi:anti-sigma regulatory factor (Ser/Thr protein kinase)
MPTTSCRTECDPTAPLRVRAWARQELDAAEIGAPISDPLAEDVILCISELVTNALQASCDEVTVDLTIDPGRVRVSVIDDGPGWPTRHEPGPDDLHGRGLLIVSALALDWGVEARDSSKVVWAELAGAG